MEIKRFKSNGRFHEAVAYNGVVYLSGKVALSDGTIEGQAKDILADIEQTLLYNNSNKESILSATVYLSNIEDFAAFNSVWDSWFKEGFQPARVCVGATLAAPQYKVEISVTAAVRQ